MAKRKRVARLRLKPGFRRSEETLQRWLQKGIPRGIYDDVVAELGRVLRRSPATVSRWRKEGVPEAALQRLSGPVVVGRVERRPVAPPRKPAPRVPPRKPEKRRPSVPRVPRVPAPPTPIRYKPGRPKKERPPRPPKPERKPRVERESVREIEEPEEVEEVEAPKKEEPAPKAEEPKKVEEPKKAEKPKREKWEPLKGPAIQGTPSEEIQRFLNSIRALKASARNGVHAMRVENGRVFGTNKIGKTVQLYSSENKVTGEIRYYWGDADGLENFKDTKQFQEFYDPEDDHENVEYKFVFFPTDEGKS